MTPGVTQFQTLTTRERDVLSRLIAGHSNKVIPSDLRLSERTVELHRARVMEKTSSRSLAQLVRMAMEVQLASSPQQRPAVTRADRQPGP